MFKVLIVDDEPFVRKGLEMLIKWEEYGFSVCGEAGNGREAMEAIRRLQPEVVITDVRMPELDGLELIKQQVHELKSSARFIILSGYDEFKYAQKAIKYGVRQYILKPIEQEELIDILKGIHTELTAEKHMQESRNREIDHYVKAIANDTVSALVKGDKSAETLERAKNLFSPDSGDRFRYVQLQALPKNRSWDEPVRLHRRTLEKAIGPEFHNTLFRISEGDFGLMLYSRMLNGKSVKAFLKALYAEICCNGETSLQLRAGREVSDLVSLEDSFQSLKMIDDYAFYFGSQDIICFEDVKNINFRQDVDKALFGSELLEAVETGQYTKIDSILADMGEYCFSQLISPSVLASALRDFKFRLLDITGQMNGNPADINEYFLQMAFEEKNLNMDGFMDKIQKFCALCAEYISGLQKNQSKGVLQQVEEYLKSNYNDDTLNLKRTAKRFYINPLYLGQLFKQAYNMRFSDYMHQLRIEEAKALLRRTDLKIYEIAARVGYKDVDYFAMKFESCEKMTPSQYRKRLLS